MLVSAMTYNVKYPERRGNGQDWRDRRPLLAEVLRRAGAHVVGTQEGHYGQLREIVADSGRYDWIGQGRERGGQGEFCAVLYDPAVLNPVAFDHFWLSDTPSVPGSVSPEWGARIVRMATWARFARPDGGELAWLNTHLDHESEVARARGAELIADWAAAVPAEVPLVVCGDFNCEPDSEPYRILTERAGLTDVWVAAGRPEHGTYGGWRAPRPDSQRIDWILVRGPVTVESAELCDYHDGDRWPSDHVPVLASLRLGA
jgi:endonuclease/exonuclease/phosphatase family metal-dependent hydrolase